MVRDTFEGVGIAWEDVQVALDKSTGGNIIKLIKLIQSAGLESDKLTALMASLAGTSYSASLAFAVQNAGDLDRLLAEAGMSAGEMDRQIDIIFSGFFGSLQKMLAMWDTFVNRLSDASISSPLTHGFRQREQFFGLDDRALTIKGSSSIQDYVTVIGNILLFGTVLLPLGLALKGVGFALGGLIPVLKWTGLGFLGVKIKTWLATKAQVAFGTTSLLTATRLGVVALATKAYSLALGIARAGIYRVSHGAHWIFARRPDCGAWDGRRRDMDIHRCPAGQSDHVDRARDRRPDSRSSAASQKLGQGGRCFQVCVAVAFVCADFRSGYSRDRKLHQDCRGASMGQFGAASWVPGSRWCRGSRISVWPARGKAIVKSLADGIISAKDYVVDKIKSIAGSIRRFFGFSDAKEGAAIRYHSIR